MVLAVLEAHCGVKLSGHDVYLNVAGGLRIQEPAADLAAAAALVSSLVNAPLPPDAVYFGEISLSGAVRPVAQTASRLKEAAKLGFGRAVLPEPGRGEIGGDAGLTLNAVGSLTTLVAEIAARGSPRGNRSSGGRKKYHTCEIPPFRGLAIGDVQPPRRYTTRARDRATSGLAGRPIWPSVRTALRRRFGTIFDLPADQTSRCR